ncbi:uncharacterized protein [Coffea arabica]|uniref:Protein ALP1-like n=1 Tax=Coffea arabica TaxID=13443 RepID=A0ABM4UY81_COFAR
MENDHYAHGGETSDESDEEKPFLIFAIFVLLGLTLFDPYLNPLQRRRIRYGSQSGAQWVVELINGHRGRIFDNLRMEAPLFLQLYDLLLKRGYWKPHPTQRVAIHESIAICFLCLSHNERYKDCVRAIDGTHVSVWCRAEDRDRYRNRHGGLSQNILAVCDHNMKFTYARVGSKGSAHDSRILRDVLLDLNCVFLMPPAGAQILCGGRDIHKYARVYGSL